MGGSPDVPNCPSVPADGVTPFGHTGSYADIVLRGGPSPDNLAVHSPGRWVRLRVSTPIRRPSSVMCSIENTPAEVELSDLEQP